MIFAVYEGNQANLITGKLYLAMPEVDEQTVVEFHKLSLIDEEGKEVWILPENNLFTYPSEVYAVLLKKIQAKVPGEVVIIDGADDGGAFLHIKDGGYFRNSFFQLLDRTVIKPNMMVYDKSKYRWDYITRIDDSMMIGTNGEPLREPTCFIFALSDGELASLPLLRCKVLDVGFTVGKIYRVAGIEKTGKLLVINDEGKEQTCDSENFSLL
jgi:hypothetical protein